ncbi:MAG: hypothetical protein M1828_003805 [Chrysothrix sp. TS-e1954]|nr:MAG: hypothetical protein M1828_003805 [Chrysothrix sp. TS-e1954]
MILRKPLVSLLAFAILTFLFPSSYALSPSEIPSDTPVSRLLTLASAALSSGSSQDALAYYDIAISRDPKNYLTYFKRGATYLSLGRSFPALADFDKVLEVKPGFEGALLQRAKIKSRNADWPGARADYEAAKKGSDSEEIKALAEAEDAAKHAKEAVKRKDWETCVTQSSLAIMTASTALQLRQMRSRCRLEKGEVVEAVGDLQHVLQINPSATDPAMQIAAMTFYSMGETIKGTEATKRCLHSDPDSKLCSKLFKKQKRITKILDKAHDLISKRTFSQAIKLLLTQSDSDPGLLDTIRSDTKEYRHLTFIHPKAPEDLLTLALSMTCSSLLEMNNHKRAQPHCTSLLGHDPTALSGLLHKSQAQLDADDFEAAIRTLQHAKEHSQGGQTSRQLSELMQKATTALKRSKTKDYYKALDLPRDASEKDIRRAYRRLSKAHHPDKATSPEARPAAEKKMATINEAYEVLSDPELKARFDAGDDPNDPTQGHGPGGAGNPFQGSPFGGGGQQQFVFRQGGGMPNFGGFGGGGGGQQFKFSGGGFPGGFPF